MSNKWMEAIYTFTESVKEGILANDMTLVAEALQEFTGEELAGMTVEDINVPPVLEQPVKKEKNPEDFTMPLSDDKEPTKQRLTKRKSLDLTERKNEFTDDGTIVVDEVGSELIDDTVAKPVKRTRKPAGGSMNITCHVCGKVELIHPSLNKEHYRCDSCCKG
jgi:hypothetical protein